MAATIKISDLDPIASGALDDSSVLPVVDGGITFKLPLSRLREFLGDSFATDSELTGQISTVNSTISELSTTEISEGSSLYYTNARVKNYIGTENVVSSSAQITNLGFYSGTTAIKNALPEGTISGSSQITITESQISDLDHYTDSDVLGYINLLAVVSGSVITQLPIGLISSSAQLPSGLVSGSTQVISLLPSGVVSGSTQVINLLPQGSISGSQQITDFGFISESVATILPQGTISGSQQITDFGFISESVATILPQGTISGSQQITDFGFISGSGFISASAQVVLADATLTGFNTSLVSEVPSNLYFTGQRVIEMLTPLHIFSGSVNTFTSSVGGGGASIPDGTISSSQQITDFGYISSSVSVVNSLPDGTISSSAQITNLGFITDASVGTTITDTVTSTYIKNRLPENTVSASAQLSSTFALLDGATGVLNLSSSLATRVSVLEGSSGITDGLVSGSAQIDYLLTENQLTFEGASITVLQTGNKVELTGSAVSYADVTNKPFDIISSSTQILDLNYVNDNELNSPDGIKTLTIPDNTTITVFAATFLDDADASSVRTTLGIPSDFAVTDSSNTFEGNQTINANLTVTGSITGDSFIVGGVGTPIIESATNLEISASADINVFAQNMIVSSSVDIGDTLKLKSWNPLPAGELGMLAVSASAAGVGGLYFYNGTVWQSVDLT
jgi:hypothetical protein